MDFLDCKHGKGYSQNSENNQVVFPLNFDSMPKCFISETQLHMQLNSQEKYGIKRPAGRVVRLVVAFCNIPDHPDKVNEPEALPHQ